MYGILNNTENIYKENNLLNLKTPQLCRPAGVPSQPKGELVEKKCFGGGGVTQRLLGIHFQILYQAHVKKNIK